MMCIGFALILVISQLALSQSTFHLNDDYFDDFLHSKGNIANGKKTRRDVSNLAPVFAKSLYVVNVPEEKEKGYLVTTLTANDPEHGLLTYSMSAVLDSRSQSMFGIDSASGVITTTVQLDREFQDVHYLRITAVDSSVPPRTGTTTLQINVNDENDHSPIFEQASYEASLRESMPVGTTVVTLRATDQDSGPNAEIEYSIINPTGINEAFRIDANNGIVTTRAALDRETHELYTLTIQATDSGPVNNRRHTQTTVSIRILDDNDNYPQFSKSSYSVQVPEDINWLNHPVITKVSASDADEGLNAAIRYTIIGGNSQGNFLMDPTNGEISVVAKLDYELSRSYRLVVRAQDAGSPPRSNTTNLLVEVIDKNDNEPKFYNTLFQETVTENTPVGTSILRVQAYDPDDGLNAFIFYSIKNARHADMPLAVDNETGWIVTTRELDWEEASLYEFSVSAQDGGYPSLSSSANVIIRVQDINDNSPVFDPKIYETSISEAEVPGSPVITVTATDKDENSRLIFQLTSGNLRGRFNIISQNGQGIISIAQPLDFKLEKKFILTVSATDPGGRQDIATVYINVTDANTHRPVIERTPYAVSIPEDTPIGTTILIVEASDADVGENARITFQMDDVSEFKIDPNTGALVTTKALDRETTAGYTIIVTATDNGVPPLADTTNVEIEVSDCNDNAPEFKQDKYTAVISEDALIGSSVAQIEALDKDLGLNGQVRYTFSGGYDGSATFVIDPVGVIRTNKLLDRESVAKYELVAFAYDRGTPAMSSSVPINVFIEDCNDNPPRFSSDRLQFFVPENSPIGWVVGELNAIDPDEGQHAKVEYSIVGGPDMKSFSLKSRPGDSNGVELITRTEMDFESDKKKYNIIIRASSLPLRNDVDVEIHVTDVNDHAPILRDFSIIFNNYKNHFPLNRVIGRIPAFDADVADKLRYKFVSGNNANLLLLNETTGQIKLSPSLNTNVPMRALFEVNVFDGINEASSTCHLIVNLVTESMLFNSVTIRLNKITQYNFLSDVYNRFLEGLAAIIPCPKENIVVFNIQDDNEVDSQILNISFSARLPDSRDSETFYSPQFLQERVYLSRAILMKLTDLEVLPFDDNLCVREPCLNFEECLSVLKFGNASDFISSDSILFRAIHPVNTFACRCPRGFQGMHHKYECDTEINLCFSGPCQNSGTCVHQEGGYVCLCADGFTGKNCEVNFVSDICRTGLCKGESRCVNSRSMKVKATPGIGGFHCINCSLSEWSTPLCELRARTFTKGSYLTFSSLRKRYRLNIRLRFATRENNALLFYNGRYNEKHDFIALELIDSRVVFTFSLGANTSQVSLALHRGSVNDGNWHQVEVDYFNRTATLKLDNCDEALLNAVERKQLEDRYACANRTTLVLESRCADKMQTCYRFLDLTGPLQIGGLPPLPTRFQIANNAFSGCIADFYVDHQLIDLNSFVANNGSLSGCVEKRHFCHSHPCLNGGVCEEAWGTFICHCPDGYGGQDCGESNQVIKQFKGDGFLSFTPRLRPLTLPWAVRFSFKTFHSQGLLVKLQLGQNTVIIIDIVDGTIRYTYNTQSLTMSKSKVNDGKWHFLEANWMINGIWLNLDYGQYEENKEFDGDIRGLYIAKVTVGGLETTDESLEFSTANFIGCIQGLDVGNSKDSWLRSSGENNVYDGCSSADPCLTNPCPTHSTCINKGLSKFECQCHLGFVGSSCIPICNLNPCSSESVCVPSNNTLGYTCKCNKMYTGTYCQEKLPETCPSNWWGYPICGPCNCDTNKRYDGNCNKTTGECSCEANHFQPVNSDVCFACDCYSFGSYSNKCDAITGQCKCRPGVIGRRCDSCPSPFAEVTLRGCEVIYDGCPKSFSEGIWWERTLFGTTAIQSCPSGSVGQAVRKCDELTGWSRPDMFDCTSQSFIELADHLSLLEKDKFPLTSYLSIKIINELRTALNTTYPLNGNDILIAFRLVQYLINHELNQKGLNLTHKQDRLFLRNLVESTSIVLEPRYAGHWDRIAETLKFGGPELFLKLFNNYIETLIENQHDTFTEPFEISAKYMIFGLDTVSSQELWDMPKSLQSFMNRTALIQSSIPSIYLDFSLPESGPSVIIPKYNNYPIRKHNIDDVTRAVIPLKTLGVKSVEEIASSPFSVSHHKSQHNIAQVGYALFPSLGQLLPAAFDFTVRHRFGMPTKVNTPLFLLTMKPLNTSKQPAKPFKIHFRLRTLLREGRNNPQCAYWSFGSNAKQKPGTNSRGKWSTKGCELKGFHPPQKYRLAYDYINCSCDRSVGIAVLMDVTNNEYYVQESFTQVLVSYTGIIASLLILAITFCILTIIRGLETNSNIIHRNLVLCLFIVELLFLMALRTRNDLVLKEFPCKMMAIFLHYFFLCLFSWMLVEGIHLYRMLTEIRDINHGPMRFYYFLGFAVPAIIVGLSVGVRADQYGNYLFCWLSIHESVIWSLVGPICLAAVCNLVVFGMALQASVQIKETVSDYGNLKTLLWLSIILLPLLGATWILAMLSVNDSLEEFHYAYTLMCIISAIYMFVGYCLVNRRVRHNIKVTWWRMNGKKVSYVDESLSGTRTSVTSRSAPMFHNSSFDILQRNMAICASSTTSRSTVTKTSSSPYRSDSQNPGVTRRPHGHRRRRRNLADSESDSSYDRSLDLASSHSSDEDDNRSAPRQNKINSAIQQNSNIVHVTEAPTYDHSMRTSNSVQDYLSDNTRAKQSKWPQMSSSVASSSQGSPLTEHGQFLTSRPYSRSNILAMTAGLSSHSASREGISASPKTFSSKELNLLNKFSQNEHFSSSNMHNEEHLQHNDDDDHLHDNQAEKIYYRYNINVGDDRHSSGDHSEEEDEEEAQEGEDVYEEGRREEQQPVDLIPPLVSQEISSDSE